MWDWFVKKSLIEKLVLFGLLTVFAITVARFVASPTITKSAEQVTTALGGR